jgi:DNA-binding response OmpR family regulator
MKKILIVDDDVLTRWGVSKALEHQIPAEITTATTGAGGIQEITAQTYDLCLLDLTLPDASGLDILQRIKEISPGTKVVIMTCASMENEIPKAVKSYAYSVLEKPFDISDLKAIAREALGNSADLPHLMERLSERIKVDSAIRYTIAPGLGQNGKLTLEGRLVDLSNQGLGMKTRHPLQPGQLLVFHTDTEQKAGVVRWVRILDDAYRVGVQFSAN